MMIEFVVSHCQILYIYKIETRLALVSSTVAYYVLQRDDELQILSYILSKIIIKKRLRALGLPCTFMQVRTDRTIS